MSIKLSICIATFNRSSFIGATLESIIVQATNDCEIVVLDGASTDDTEHVVSEYTRRSDRLRYIRQDTNNGVDRDFDRAVELARGEYCWLFSDDDLLKPGAVAAVLEALRGDFSLVLVNGEHRDFSMSIVRIPSFFEIDSDKAYASGEMDSIFVELGRCLICICCVVIKRAIWLERERERYYGSRFIHIGVIFQQPLPGKTFAISAPLICLRLGNDQTHAREGFLVWYINLPALVWSLCLSKTTKKGFCSAEPWRKFRYLLALRGKGEYSSTEYQRVLRPRLRSSREALVPALVVCLPRKLAHRLYMAYSFIAGHPSSSRSPWQTMLPKSWNRYVDGLASARDDRS